MNLIIKQLTESTLQEEMLDEVAKDMASVLSEKLALRVSNQNGYISLDLYDPLIIEDKIVENDYSRSAFAEAIIGSISFEYRKNDGFWMVGGSAAEKGYGPLMYDLAMSVISPDFLGADRASVSEQARKVWNYMLTVRANDYQMIPIRSKEDAPALKHAFAIKNPIDYSGLVANHNEAVERFYRLYKVRSEITNDAIETGGNKFFSIKYHSRAGR